MAKREPTLSPAATPATKPGKPSALLNTRVVRCGDNLEQLAKFVAATINGTGHIVAISDDPICVPHSYPKSVQSNDSLLDDTAGFY